MSKIKGFGKIRLYKYYKILIKLHAMLGKVQKTEDRGKIDSLFNTRNYMKTLVLTHNVQNRNVVYNQKLV